MAAQQAQRLGDDVWMVRGVLDVVPNRVAILAEVDRLLPRIVNLTVHAFFRPQLDIHAVSDWVLDDRGEGQVGHGSKLRS
ncbi:MAG: hypothetical protein FJX60_23030 [Alphaproteobacteria bacterium]|nr:hypothetical protein [Alphaproteobacteria bacterium]